MRSKAIEQLGAKYVGRPIPTAKQHFICHETTISVEGLIARLEGFKRDVMVVATVTIDDSTC